MTTIGPIDQHPSPGTRKVLFCGDTVTFTLILPAPAAGSAGVRTNIGRAAVTRREIRRAVDRGEAPLGRAGSTFP